MFNNFLWGKDDNIVMSWNQKKTVLFVETYILSQIT